MVEFEKSMKIIIDARFWGPKDTGLGVYAQKLIENLVLLDKKNNYVILLRKKAFDSLIFPQNFQKVLVEARPYTLKEQIFLAKALFKHRADLVHFPSINTPIFYFGRYIVTVHDLIKHDFKGVETTTKSPAIYWLKQFVYSISFRLTIRRAVKIITPSETVKGQLIKRFNLDEAKIEVTYEAAVLGGKGDNKSKIYNNYNLPSKFAIYTGNGYPHKNLKRLINAWKEIYQKTGTHLLLICGRTVFSARLQKIIDLNQAKNYIHLKGFLEDEELEQYYSKALIYVFPSLSEGFGIPGLDALNCDLPLVCSDIPVFREIYGEAACYFNPQDEKDISQKISAVINNHRLKQKLIKQGREQAKRYSWDKMAKQTLEIYQQNLIRRIGRQNPNFK